MKYEPLSKYPVIKADVTILTNQLIPYKEIEQAVQLPDWKTLMVRHHELTDRYAIDDTVSYTFHLEVGLLDHQPKKSDMAVWSSEIARYLSNHVIGRIT